MTRARAPGAASRRVDRLRRHALLRGADAAAAALRGRARARQGRRRACSRRAYPAGCFFGAIPSGIVAARFGVKPTVLVGMSCVAVTTALFGFAQEAWQLDLARFLQGLASAFSWTGALAWLVAASPATKRGALIGQAFAFAVAGALFGPGARRRSPRSPAPAATFSAVAIALARHRRLGRRHARRGARRAAAALDAHGGGARPARPALDLARRPPRAALRHARRARAAAAVRARLRRDRRSARSGSSPACSRPGTT